MKRAKFQDIVNKMTTLRSSPSPSPSIEIYPIIQEMFNQSLTLRGGHPNNTEMIPLITESTIYNLETIQRIAFGVIQLGVAFFLLQTCAMCIVANRKKQKQENVSVNIPNPYTWVMNKYKQWRFAEVLPTIRPKKAKESPFCGPLQTPPILPTCPRLDGAEKGQNIMFRFRGPTNSRIESESTNSDTETRITIVAVVENNSKPPLAPKPIVAVQPV
jgi:hypothetical protein